MKKTFQSHLANAFVFAILILQPPGHSIVGKWKTREPDNTVSYINFTSEGTFSYSNQGKIIHQGKYKQDKDVFTISDGECGTGYWAKYKLTFIGEDSVSFSVISDTCSGRVRGVNGNGLKRTR